MFCRLILVYALILSLNNPISIIIQATGNIRAYSTYVEIPTLLCFPVTWALFAVGMPAESAFYVMIGAITISHVIRLVCLKLLFPKFSYQRYVVVFVLPAIAVVVLVSVALYLLRNAMAMGFVRLCISFVVAVFMVALLCWLFGLSKYEKNILLSLVKFRKKIVS